MCFFGSGGANKTSTAPTVYDGKGRAKATDRRYKSVEKARLAYRNKDWGYDDLKGTENEVQIATPVVSDYGARR